MDAELKGQNIDSGDRAVRDLILLVDTSGSMEGFKRVEVGCFLENVVVELHRQKIFGDSTLVRLSILFYDMKARWQCVRAWPEDVRYEIQVGGASFFGEAYRALAGLLSGEYFGRERELLLNGSADFERPVIVLITDGLPSSFDEYPTPVHILRECPLFASAIRLGVAIGEDADRELLDEFTGSSMARIDFEDNDFFSGDLVRYVLSVALDENHPPLTDFSADRLPEELKRTAIYSADSLARARAHLK